MDELIVETIVVIVVFTIFILNLLKVIKLYNKDNIIVKAKIKLYRYYVAGERNPYYDYIMKYQINNEEYEEKYDPFFYRREYSYVKLIVNKFHGNIITTNLTRNVLVFLLLVNSFFPVIMISSFFEKILDLLSF